MIKRIYNEYIEAFRGLPRKAWLLALIVLINRSGTMVLFFMTLYLTSQHDFSVADAGKMISVYGIGSMIGAFLGGWLTDRIGSMRVQALSLFSGGMGFIGLAYVHSPAAIAVMLFILAIFSESLRPANAAAFAEVCPPDIRARGFALNRLAINVGVAIGPAIGGFLALVSYSYLFWADGITCILAGFLLLTIFGFQASAHESEAPISEDVARSPYRDKIYLSVLLLLLMMGMLFVQLFSTWPLYLKDVYTLIEDRIGILLALNAVLVALLEMPLIHKIEKYNIIRIMAIGALFLFAGFAILPAGSSFAYAAFTVIIWSIGEMLVFPLVAGFIANRATDQNRGKYMGLFTFSFALSFVLGPIAGSWVYDHLGADILWYISGLVGLLVFGGFYLIDHFLKHEVPNTS